VGILYSNADALEATGLVKVETQDGGGSSFAPTAVTIPAGYKDIVITGSIFTNAVSTYDYPEFIINGDGDDTHYVRGFITQRSTAINGYEGSGIYTHAFGTCTPSTGDPCGFRLTFPCYAGTVSQKQILAHSTWRLVSASQQYNDLSTYLWLSTSTITSVTLGSTEDVSLFGAGSSFTVWVR
jgi:hypothetical protein